ncbi:hypothetical protein FOXYSP1_16010 [Fusarium oxysporum f. sp. phaseoli]
MIGYYISSSKAAWRSGSAVGLIGKPNEALTAYVLATV